jgi:putative Ca2+/H+ antiporter (TMEM165/GDT1 family)
MSEFWIYFQVGLHHVLNWLAYDHVLFLVALVISLAFRDWKRIVMLVSVFTIGHTLALFLSVFEVVQVKVKWVEFLIPITILITALWQILTASKSNKKSDNSNFILITTLFFGIIHGLGFSNYFNSILPGKPTDKIFPLLEFALGIELAQLIVVLSVLVLSYILQHFFRVSRRDFILIFASIVVGIVLPLIFGNEIFN